MLDNDLQFRWATAIKSRTIFAIAEGDRVAATIQSDALGNYYHVPSPDRRHNAHAWVCGSWQDAARDAESTMFNMGYQP